MMCVTCHAGCVLRSAQTRALQTYIKRVYYPFLLRDPEIHAPVDGVLTALWVHTHPTLAGMPQASHSRRLRQPHCKLGALHAPTSRRQC